VSTDFLRCQNRISPTRRRGILESGFLSKFFVQPFRYENSDRRFFQWSFTANASQWRQAIRRSTEKMERVLVRQTNALASIFSRWRVARQIARAQMLDINRSAMIFIKEDTPLPSTVSMESEPFLPGWRIIKNLDRRALTRAVEGAHWNVSYLAGEIRTTVFGYKSPGTLRRAAKYVLARQEEQNFKFNSLELTKLVSKQFLGIPFMGVTAHSRRIQRGFGLDAPKILL
jgi:hypothetical protein